MGIQHGEIGSDKLIKLVAASIYDENRHGFTYQYDVYKNLTKVRRGDDNSRDLDYGYEYNMLQKVVNT
jgi:hypothetical protein